MTTGPATFMAGLVVLLRHDLATTKADRRAEREHRIRVVESYRNRKARRQREDIVEAEARTESEQSTGLRI